jgi:hypothetical protein
MPTAATGPTCRSQDSFIDIKRVMREVSAGTDTVLTPRMCLKTWFRVASDPLTEKTMLWVWVQPATVTTRGGLENPFPTPDSSAACSQQSEAEELLRKAAEKLHGQAGGDTLKQPSTWKPNFRVSDGSWTIDVTKSEVCASDSEFRGRDTGSTAVECLFTFTYGPSGGRTDPYEAVGPEVLDQETGVGQTASSGSD